MAQTALFTSPMAKKKTVLSKYSPNSYRVISHEAEERYPPPRLSSPFSLSNTNVVGQPQHVHPWEEHRYNRPNPTNVDFLRHDVRLLNEPVCNVYNRELRGQEKDWWPSRFSKYKPATPPKTKDSTMRADYIEHTNRYKGYTRHESNPNKTPARGTIPVNFMRQPNGEQRLMQEDISYEHQYNSRSTPSYPVRSRRHGAFVWDTMSSEQSEAMMKALSESNKENGTTPHSQSQASCPPVNQSHTDCHPTNESQAAFPPVSQSPSRSDATPKLPLIDTQNSQTIHSATPSGLKPVDFM